MNPQFQFEKVLRRKRSGTRHMAIHLRGKEVTVLFKIQKKGRKYSASVSAPDAKTGQRKWLHFGEQTLLKFNPKLAFYSCNRDGKTLARGGTHEVNVCFERVVVRQLK